LKIDGCLSDENENLKYFIEFLTSYEKLLTISFQGTTHSFLTEKNMISIFRTLKGNSSLKEVDCSHHKIGSFGLIELGKCISKSFIRNLNFSPCGVHDKTAYESFLKCLKKRNTYLQVFWPDKEMKMMLDSKVINQNQLQHFKNLFEDISRKGNRKFHRNIQCRKQTFIPSYRMIFSSSRSFLSESDYICSPFTDDMHRESEDPISMEELFKRITGIQVPEIPNPPQIDYASLFEKELSLNVLNTKYVLFQKD
jgi:hypothetical protein